MTSVTDAVTPTGVRALADDYVRRLAVLDTRVATSLGTHPGDDRNPDLSPEGQQAFQTLLPRLAPYLSAEDWKGFKLPDVRKA